MSILDLRINGQLSIENAKKNNFNPVTDKDCINLMTFDK